MATVSNPPDDRPDHSRRLTILTVLLLVGVILTLFVIFTANPGPGNFSVGGAVIGLTVGVFVLAAVVLGLLLYLMKNPLTQTYYPGEEGAASLQMTERPGPLQQVVQQEATTRIEPAEEGQHVLTLEGIGSKYATRLNNHGIITIPQLIAADPDTLAHAVDATSELVQTWQAMGRLYQVKGIGPQVAEMLALAGIRTIEQLAEADPSALTAKIDLIESRRKVRVMGTDVKEGHVRRWVAAARDHPTPLTG